MNKPYGALFVFLIIFESGVASAVSNCALHFAESSADRSKRGGQPRHRVLRNLKLDWSAAEAFAKSKYATPEGGIRVLNQLKNLGEPYLNLIIDPGIALNIDAFVEFVRASRYQDIDPWIARDEFSAAKGDVIVYRGLALSDAEFNVIWADGQGLNSSYSQYWKNTKSSKNDKDITEIFVREGINAVVHSKLFSVDGLGDNPGGLLQSVTRHPDVARGVPTMQYSGKRIYVFRIKIPKVDLIYHSPGSDIISSPTNISYVNETFDHKIPFVDESGKRRLYDINHDLESFVFYKIDRDEILDYRAFDPIPYLLSL